MTHLSPINLYSPEPGPVSPTFIGQRERVTCPKCNCPIVIAARPEFIDWEQVANNYKAYATKLSKHYSEIASETERMFGDNPAAAYFNTRILEMIDRLKREMNKSI